MNFKHLIAEILNIIIRACIAIIVVVYIYRGAMLSYHFGYMVFLDAAREPSPGRDIAISIDYGEGISQVAKTLEDRGVIDDKNVFRVQEFLSEYKGKLEPGVYTLNTSMKPSEILAAISSTAENEEDGTDSTDNSYTTPQAGASITSLGGDNQSYDEEGSNLSEENETGEYEEDSSENGMVE